MTITVNDKYIYSEIFTLKESKNENTGKMGYYFNTKIVPYNVKSRNGIMYKREFIEKTKDMLIGKHLMYNHIIDSKDLPNGEWVSVESKDDGLYGKARVYNTEYNKPFIEFLQEASAPRVSLQIMGQAETFSDDDGGQYQVAYINDWLEASVVAVPGFDGAKGQGFEYALAEAYKKNITVNTLKEDINLSTANGALKPADLPGKDDNKEELNMSDEKQKKKSQDTADKNEQNKKGQEAVEDEDSKKEEVKDEDSKKEEVEDDKSKKEEIEDDKDSKKEEVEDDKAKKELAEDDSKKEEAEDEDSKKEAVEDDSKKEEVEDKYAGLEERIAKLEAVMDNDDAKKEAVEDDSKEVEEESKTEKAEDDEEKKEEVREAPEDSEEEPAKPKTESINSILSFDIISEDVSSKENDFSKTIKEILG